MAYQGYLELRESDLWAVDFALCAFLAAKSDRNTEPLFAGIVGPPASGKTEILRPFMDWKGMSETFNEATENAYLSGSPTVSKSLMHCLERRALVLQDLTSLMGKDTRKLDGFLSTMRSAFDGSYRKVSGALSDQRAVHLHFSILLAVTEQIYQFLDKDVDMGQRFLFLRIGRHSTRASRQRIFSRIMANEGEDDWRIPLKTEVRSQVCAIRDAWGQNMRADITSREGEGVQEYQQRLNLMRDEEVLGWHRTKPPQVTFTDEFLGQMFALVNLVTRVRSAKLWRSQGQEAEESVSRVTKQLKGLARIRAACDGRTSVGPDDYEMLRIVAQDTVSPNRIEVLRVLQAATTGNLQGMSIGQLSQRCHLNSEALESALAHWEVNKFVRSRGSGVYVLSDDVLADLNDSHLLDPIGTAP